MPRAGTAMSGNADDGFQWCEKHGKILSVMQMTWLHSYCIGSRLIQLKRRLKHVRSQCLFAQER